MVLDGVEFRKKQIASKREEAFVQGQTLHLLERYLTIEQVLGLVGVDEIGTAPREGPYPIKEVADAENAARAIRVHWGLGIDPIPNLSELLEGRGIKVLSAELTDIDGLYGDGTPQEWRANTRDCREQECMVGAEAIYARPRTRPHAGRMRAGRERGDCCQSLCKCVPHARWTCYGAKSANRSMISLGELIAPEAVVWRKHSGDYVSLPRAWHYQRRKLPAAVPGLQ